MTVETDDMLEAPPPGERIHMPAPSILPVLNAVGLGGVFISLALRLWREAERRSALRTYLFSLAYLALLFCAMVLDARL